MSEIEPHVVVAALTGEASEAELRRLREWRAESLDNERAYRRWARVWAVSGQFLDEAEDEAPPSPHTIIGQAQQRHPAREVGVAMRRSVLAGHRKWAAAAAILVVGLGLGLATARSERDPTLLPRTMTTGAGEVATVTLGDGTVVHLGPESQLDFTGQGYEREVSLDGRAYFAVTSDASRPFRVRLAKGTVEVLGTRFDVHSRGEDLQVTVVEGLVEMEADGGLVRVEANQLGVARVGQAPTVSEVGDVFEVINWLGRFLAFESTPLAEVAVELGRRFGMSVEVTDPDLRQRTVTAWFGDQSPDDLMRGICAAVAAQCVIGEASVTMEPLS